MMARYSKNIEGFVQRRLPDQVDLLRKLVPVIVSDADTDEVSDVEEIDLEEED